MASVRKHPTRDLWRVRWRDADGSEKSAYFKKHADAKLHRSRIEQAQATGTYIDPALGRILLAEYATAHVANADLAPTTRALYEGHLRSGVPESGEGLRASLARRGRGARPRYARDAMDVAENPRGARFARGPLTGD